jgi:hypothetical protein
MDEDLMLVIPFRSLTGSYGDLFTGDRRKDIAKRKRKECIF